MEFDKWIRANAKRYGHVSPAQEIALRDAFEAGAKIEREACSAVCIDIGKSGEGMAGEIWAERCANAIRMRTNVEITGSQKTSPVN